MSKANEDSPLRRRLRLWWERPRPSSTAAALARVDAETRLRAVYPRFFARSSAAIDAHSLMLVVNDAVINSRSTVVELGAGWSTFVLASALREQGGRLVSVEHDPGWHDLVKSRLEREDLAGAVDLVRAPLRDGWYGRAELDEGLAGREIDSLLVDGPPAMGKGQSAARAQAVPALLDRLSPAAVVFLHDIDRPGERAIALDWSQRLGVKPRFHPDNPKLAWFRRQKGFGFK